ncbi:MAG: glycosyltransferase family 1 protein [Ferruginibacter sp.]|nr:glycosyltransferase family 4 protein [Chitinophagaceae bacterium]
MNKIIFDCERMKYENTGLYHYCLNLGNHLRKFIQPGSEELAYYSPVETINLFGKNQKHIIQNELHKFRLPALDKYKIWHATYQDSYYIPFLNTKIKVVLSIHDLNFMYDPLKSEFKKERNLRRLQILINRADVIICISEYCKKDVLFYCDVKNKPVHVIHNGTNTLTKPGLLKQSYIPVKPFIFSLGTIMPKKNMHTLLPLLKDQPNLELIIAGRIDDVGYYQSILDTAKIMGVSKYVNIVGPISENEKSWYFNNCYAFAFPSTAEGFGLPVTEAMSVGKPLFLSNKTALPEIGGDVAFYFENFSAAHMKETFVAGMKQYKLFNMQQEIVNKGKEYNWNIAAQEYWKIYRSLY